MSIKFKWRTMFAAAACLTLIMASGCSFLPKEDEVLAPPLVKPVKQHFDTVEVKKGSIEETIKGIGIFQPYVMEYQQFKSDGGRIQKIFVKAGDIVRKGDPLIQLDVENLDIDIKSKELDLEKAKAGLQDATASGDKEQIKIKKLELEIAQLIYDRTLKKLNDRTLRASMDGVVTYVTSAQPPDNVKAYDNLVVIADMHKLRIMIRKDDVGSLTNAQVGMLANVKWNDKEFKAKVVQTPDTAPQTGDDQLREQYAKSLYLDPEKLPDGAQIGDYMDVTIVTKKKDNTLIIPNTALHNFMSRYFVQVQEGESIRESDVEVGIKTPTEVEILAGVKEGQKLILK